MNKKTNYKKKVGGKSCGTMFLLMLNGVGTRLQVLVIGRPLPSLKVKRKKS